MTAGMVDAMSTEHERREDLLSAIDVIEQQPLAERAAVYAALHDELSRRLEASPRDSHS